MAASAKAAQGRGFEVGGLCLANGKPAILRFKGEARFGAGVWYGVEFIDKALGKNDGAVQGFRYFSCPPNHGLFVRESALKPYSDQEKAAVAIQSLARGSKARKKAKQDMALHAWTQLENNEESEFHVNNRDVASQVTREIRRKYGAGEEPKALLQTATQRRLSRSVYGTTPRASISEAALMAEQIPDSYTGPRIDWPITWDMCHRMVRHYIESPDVILHRRYAWELLCGFEDQLEDTVPNAVRHFTIPKESGARLLLCGDVHGQLADVLFLFYKFGYPSPNNVYLFNGDLCDRGMYATEILLLICAFNLLHPGCVLVNRGNHESTDMNEVYGFALEVRQKYGGLIFQKFQDIFHLLPLCTIIDDRIFCVHAGLCRRDGISLLHLNAVDRYRPCPDNPVSFQDTVMFDLLWSDPQPHYGIGRSTRGPDCIVYGPDITDRFLARNKLEVCIRSHEVPSTGRGFEVQHQGKCVTVFSASNYCGASNNYGGVILFQSDLSFEIQEYWAPTIDQLREIVKESDQVSGKVYDMATRLKRAEKRRSTFILENAAERMAGDVIEKLKKLICEKKQDLWWWFWSVDENKEGKITANLWREACNDVLGDSLPWVFLQKELNVVDSDGMVDYERFLRRFRVEFKGDRLRSEKWKRDTVQQIFEAILMCDLSLRETLLLFDRNSDGTVSFREFREFISTFCPGLTEPQVMALMRTITADHLAKGDASGRVHVAAFLARFEVTYNASIAKKYTEPWIEKALKSIGRLIRTESPDDSLKRLGITGSPDMSPASSKGGGGLLAPPKDPLEHIRRRSSLMRAFTLMDKFQQSDKKGEGFLSYDDFIVALRGLPLKDCKKDVGFELTDQHLRKLAEVIDVVGNGRINYLEFLRAFQVVDHSKQAAHQAGDEIWEQICTTIFKHAPTLRRALQQFDPDYTGYVKTKDLQKALETLNNVLSRTEAPLTDEQINLLVETLEKDSDTLCYDVLLDSFVVVDCEAPQQQQGGQSPTATPGISASKHPKVNVEPDTDVVMADVA
mmetsp:Transcript_21369/g.52271  ORF Transcript_21369/g.52271 Transcript_21369/m.52271 type:complete len:1022 (-) Transcript_21369:549-3614(-)